METRQTTKFLTSPVSIHSQDSRIEVLTTYEAFIKSGKSMIHTHPGYILYKRVIKYTPSLQSDQHEILEVNSISAMEY